jgi:hypothetical protein
MQSSRRISARLERALLATLPATLLLALLPAAPARAAATATAAATAAPAQAPAEAPAQAQAPAPAAGGPESAPLRELPDLVLNPWLSSQTTAGNFAKPSGLVATDGYGNAGIAYGMLQEAARTGDERYFRASMKTFSWLARTRKPLNGVFYQMFSAAAYNLARERFGNSAQFRRIRVAWANKLRRFPYQRGRIDDRYHYNKNLVEALEIIELFNSGLRGNSASAILKDRRVALRQALRVMNVLIPRRVDDYSQNVGAAEGWPFDTTIANMSDPPDNPPAYDALVAGLYARAYERLAPGFRTDRMRQAAATMTRGVIARTAPDGDIAFDGRSQEQAWSLSAAAYAAWAESEFTTGTEREIYLAFARRVVQRLENAYVTSSSSFGFVLTPAAGCCDRQERPPGQDLYYDVAKYSGLTALSLGWAIEARPTDWQAGSTALPTDGPADLVYGLGRGRFFEHRGGDVYWFLRMQSDYYDARSDMGLAVMKLRSPDGSWRDVVPPRPYTGGHHRPADPGAPCLVFRRGCAYLELHGGAPDGAGGYQFDAIWRTARRTLVRQSTATVTPLARGLRITWAALPADRFELDNFLPAARCAPDGVSAPGVTVVVTGQTSCTRAKGYFAGGARVDLRRTHSFATAQGGVAGLTYTATAN